MSSDTMAEQTGWTLRVDIPGLNVNPISRESLAGWSAVKDGAQSGAIARKRKLEYLEFHRQRVEPTRKENLGGIRAIKHKPAIQDGARKENLGGIRASEDKPALQEGTRKENLGGIRASEDKRPAVQEGKRKENLRGIRASEHKPALQEAGSSLTGPENPPPTSKWRKEPEETRTANFNSKEVNDVSCKEARERRSVVSKFRDLVQKEQERLEKEDDPQTIKLFDYASDKLKFLSRNLSKNHIGSVPGVEVGDVFQSRRLLSMIGLHGPIQGGIYYLKPEETGCRVPLATSIVISGGYEDNIDNGDVVIYTGQGGQDHHRGKKQVYDQQLTRGNEALCNSRRKKLPIRLIRSCEDVPCGYRYDGLYIVENSWSEKGRAGFRVYKFKLKRKLDQPPLLSQVVRLRGSLHGKKTSVIKEDIGEGRHKFSIPVVNSIDNVYTIDDFKYLLTVEYPDQLAKPQLPEGCSCIGGCSDSDNCLCARNNGGEFPYRANGTLVKAKPVVYECGPKCSCPPTCTNRVAQHGLKHKFEIFRTPRKEWGVRTLEFIQAGAFIAEYTGKLDCSPNSSINKFSLPIMSISVERNSSDRPGVVSASTFQAVEHKGFNVDASRSGNASRFIRRSSTPNVFAQYVLHDHHDRDIPHIMLFALENIPPQLELSISSSAQQRVHSQFSSEARNVSKARIHFCSEARNVSKARINSLFRKQN